MIGSQKVVVVMPAFNAARTLERTCDETLATGVVDLIIVVDDASRDDTMAVAAGVDGVVAYAHAENRGYGANQKTCYRLALEHGADIVVMVHPDYQYTPKLIPAMASMIASGLYSCVIGSRILGGQALDGGMPMWRYISNRALTFIGNALVGTKVSEFHTGYRAFSRALLSALPLDSNSDDFVFDHEILAQTAWLGLPIGEVLTFVEVSRTASAVLRQTSSIAWLRGRSSAPASSAFPGGPWPRHLVDQTDRPSLHR
jgi:glycosyltransferase involved in cell wall biosynthesis